MPPLQIYDPRERVLVGLADRALAGAVAVARPFSGRTRPSAPARVLLLRLERIGDLLMALPAVADIRAALPAARLELVVGSWNASLAEAIRGIDEVHVLDAAWLARGRAGLGLPALLKVARGWRRAHYDLAINFEPDIRSNLLVAASGAGWTAGYSSGGGGALLDVSLEYDVRAHTTANARRLAAAALQFKQPADRPGSILDIGPEAAKRARLMLTGARRPVVGIHASGGRAVKQWPPERFAEVGRRLVDAAGATIVLTGSPADRELVDGVATRLPRESTIVAAGEGDLLVVGALLQQLDLLVTGDTGPMHLAHAVGTPVVAVFGPSDPARYATAGPFDRIVRVDLPCAPCNRIRLPPARCVGHTPDCLASISAVQVFEASLSVLAASGALAARAASGRTDGA